MEIAEGLTSLDKDFEAVDTRSRRQRASLTALYVWVKSQPTVVDHGQGKLKGIQDKKPKEAIYALDAQALRWSDAYLRRISVTPDSCIFPEKSTKIIDSKHLCALCDRQKSSNKVHAGLQASLAAQNLSTSAGDVGSTPRLGRLPEEENGLPTQLSLPGEFQGQSSLAATVPGVTKSRTRLSDQR